MNSLFGTEITSCIQLHLLKIIKYLTQLFILTDKQIYMTPSLIAKAASTNEVSKHQTVWLTTAHLLSW